MYVHTDGIYRNAYIFTCILLCIFCKNRNIVIVNFFHIKVKEQSEVYPTNSDANNSNYYFRKKNIREKRL